MWITNSSLIKSIFKKFPRRSGRSKGCITVRHRGGGIKHKTRVVDFLRPFWNAYAIVFTLEFNSLQKSYISLISYPFGVFAYVLAPVGLRPGSLINNGIHPSLGSCLFLKDIPFNIKFTTSKPAPQGVPVLFEPLALEQKSLKKQILQCWFFLGMVKRNDCPLIVPPALVRFLTYLIVVGHISARPEIVDY